ncbi:adenylyltransferase/cytidyltransferase family protein [Pelagibaculum spongiae]|nr:adenylyltransferase/cytidyltransferase family protein [Pelagibaculum spongiae]
MEHIAIYGAAFDPPHLGHMDVVQQLLQQFDAVWLIPSAKHAFGKQMSDYQLRLKMLEIITTEQISERDRIVISTLEQDLLEIAPNQKAIFSFDLLNEVQKRQPQSHISLVVGPDNAKPDVWKKFYRHQDIERDFNLIVAEERLPIRSTDCRKLLRTTNDDLSHFTGAGLAGWLRKNNLYI